MKTKTLKTVHPGEVLVEEFLKPMGISQYRLGVATGLPHSRVTDICRERRNITADSALRLARCLGTTPEFWMRLQLQHDLRVAEFSNTYAAIPCLAASA